MNSISPSSPLPDVRSPAETLLLMVPLPPRFKPASIGKRFLASVVDAMLVNWLQAPLSIFGVVAGLFLTQVDPRLGQAFSTLFQLIHLGIGFGVSFIYFGWFYKKMGASPGKLLMKLKVVDTNTGQPLDYGASFLREIVGKFLSLLTLLVGYLLPFFRRDKRALHDLVASSEVVEDSAELLSSQ